MIGWHAYNKLRFALVVSLTFVAIPAQAQIIFTAPPRETSQQAAALYQPVADLFSQALNEQVVYKQPQNWVTYLDMLVEDQAQIYFSEPHSVGFQIAHHKHRLLVRGPDEKWLIVARKGSDYKFAGRRACLLPPPDFGHMLFIAQEEFVKNPGLTPHVQTVELYEDAVIGLIQNECQYTAVPDYFYSLFPESYRGQLQDKILITSPGQAFTAAGKLTTQQVNELRNALLSDAGQSALKNLRSRFMNGAQMYPANDTAAYIEQSMVLVDGYLRPLRIIK